MLFYERSFAPTYQGKRLHPFPTKKPGVGPYRTEIADQDILFVLHAVSLLGRVYEVKTRDGESRLGYAQYNAHIAETLAKAEAPFVRHLEDAPSGARYESYINARQVTRVESPSPSLMRAICSWFMTGGSRPQERKEPQVDLVFAPAGEETKVWRMSVPQSVAEEVRAKHPQFPVPSI